MNTSKNDDDSVRAITEYFNEQIPFNKVLGLRVESINPESVSAVFQMRVDLLGHSSRRMLHGGVIAAVIDVTGGLSALMNIQDDAGRNFDARMKKADWLSTLDLRVDFLRPATGNSFIVKGYPLRTSKKIAVIRTELINDEDNLVAVGTATYHLSKEK